MRSATLGLALVVVMRATALALAEDTQPPTTSTTATPAAPATDAEDVGLTSPRSTLRGYLAASRAGEYDKAAEHLDLRRIPKSHRDTVGPLFARRLKTVLDRAILIDLDALSDAPEGDRDDGLPARRDLVGTVRLASGGVDVLLERIPLPDGSLGWKVSGATIADVPALYGEIGDGPLADFLPAPLIEIEFLAVRLWQWIGLVLLAGLAVGVAWLATSPLLRLLGMVVKKAATDASDRRYSALVAPLRLTIGLAVFSAGIPWLALSLRATTVLVLVRKTIAIAAVTWLWLRLVDVVASGVAERLRARRRYAAVSVIPLGRRAVKVFVATLAAIAIVQNLGYDATGIIAGLGVGGLALALAAQKTIENLFGGVTLVADQPVRVGDQCRFGTRVGVVEDIGLRSTRIRTPERTIVSVPNGEFAGMQIENLTKRDRMWLSATLGLRLETTGAQLRRVLDAIAATLAAEPKVDRASIVVRFAGFGATSLDAEISAYVLTRDWNEFTAIREGVFLKVLDLLAEAGAAIAPRPPVGWGAGPG